MTFTAGRVLQLSQRRFKITLLDDGGHEIICKEITDSRPTAEYIAEQCGLTVERATEVVYSSLDFLERQQSVMFMTYKEPIFHPDELEDPGARELWVYIFLPRT
jgi:NH3-dependent NAD+ synthetase